MLNLPPSPHQERSFTTQSSINENEETENDIENEHDIENDEFENEIENEIETENEYIENEIENDEIENENNI